MDPKALVRYPGLDLVQERNLPPVVLVRHLRHVRHDVQILDVRDLLVQRRELVKVRREEAEGVDLGSDLSGESVRGLRERK